jgi:tetratricopeptide (TPR) repeat protein
MTGSIIMKTAIGFTLMAVFCLLAAVMIMPLAAQIRFAAAEDLVRHYKWAQAEAEFRDAIKLDPFNAAYHAGLGSFILAQSVYQAHKEPLLKTASGYLTKAVELDPRDAGYWVDLGLLEMAGKSYEKAFAYFRKAAENDPNGFNAAYSTGSAGLGVWNRIGEADRSFTIDRLKTALMSRPSLDVYALAWNARKDIGILKAMTPGTAEAQRWLYDFITSRNLWQYRKAQAQTLKSYMERERPGSLLAGKKAKEARLNEVKEGYKRRADKRPRIAASDWSGQTPDRKFRYTNGEMYWSGTMDAAIEVPAGGVAIKISAKGQPADKVYPYMIVELDEEEIGEAFVDSPEWKEYVFKTDVGSGLKVLSVTFANDACTDREDRNLFVGGAEVEAKR